MNAVAERYPPSISRLSSVAGRALLSAQAVAAVRVVGRLLASRGGRPIRDRGTWNAGQGTVSVVVPVLNEQDRLGPCLDGLVCQGPEVTEILVVDGGSADDTRRLVASFEAQDRRVRWVRAGPVPPDWNGKAWGLQAGLERATRGSGWVLAVDADVRPCSGLVRALVAHAAGEGLASLSAATLQELAGSTSGLVHPALLATLVYRFGSPGGVARTVADVQANGQCALFRRDVLDRYGGFGRVRASRCEDVTIARLLVAGGERVELAETDGLISARMYENAGEAWRGWTRSLPMRDELTHWSAPIRLADVALTQALPLPIVLAALTLQAYGPVLGLNVLLLVIRLGVLAGMRRAYPGRPWTYWLSPLIDLPVTAQLWASMLTRRHTWRGRPLVVVQPVAGLSLGRAAPATIPSAAPAAAVPRADRLAVGGYR